MKPRAYSYLRMSTDLQLKGDSRRRQLEASRSYAEAEGLELADDGQLEDIGISAFRGANVRDGALGQFLAAVKAGAVERGSYLLVESLDRLSREEILPAHTLFLSVVQAGINLVTLVDKRVYRAESTNLVDMITSLVIMERAHEESKTKSIRVGAAWKNKRAKAAAGQPMTARCPAWLRLTSDRQRYEIIPERVKIVQQIFAETVSGVGMYSVAMRLNRMSVPAFVGKNGWHQSYIAKTLANRSVLGEFQPHIRVAGKRVADGEPLTDYFPPIVSEELFYRAQHARSARRVGGSGRKGRGYTNLFTGLVRCAYCSSLMVFENKGFGRKGGTYLICSNAQRRRGCDGVRWRYPDFETSFLASVQELGLKSIIAGSKAAHEQERLSAEITALRGELRSVSDLMEKTYAVLSAGGPAGFVATKLNELTSKQADLSERLERKEADQSRFLARGPCFYQNNEEVRELVKKLQTPVSDELYKLRAEIASRIRALVRALFVAPQGVFSGKQKSIQFLRTEADNEHVAFMKRAAARLDQPRRCFCVEFKNAAPRTVFPSSSDPFCYQQEAVEDERLLR
jgi:DNA invertase Pin-like site-specific DNA recombinase